ncbi:helix-turn-helix transcriptional regulator [Thioalkalivibrio sp. K90mix]|uniref:helix-turn-helix domain-containing protein n=1 Tax=Thioalkalivibrio sp. (strain K90mix) TaxID=396595 RepID=UPI00036D56B6|nr:helix-turn-helix transcriptional regulator [Thioalkalivibrio sp. K90mix]
MNSTDDFFEQGDRDSGSSQSIPLPERLRNELAKRNWRQSDLARACGMGRDAISTYMKGRSHPSPENAKKMARVLGCSVSDLLPGFVGGVNDTGRDGAAPALEIRQSSSDPSRMWVQVNQAVTPAQAMAIMEILQNKGG